MLESGLKRDFGWVLMWIFIGKTILAAALISFVSWLSGQKTVLAGFLTALPLMSILALAFSQAEWGDPKQSVAYAKSIFAAIPISITFFVPFLLAERWNLGFWTCYISGICLLGLGYFAHSAITKAL